MLAYAPVVALPQALRRLMRKENVLRPARGMRIVAALAVGGLTLAAAACGKAPSTTTPGGTAAPKYIACMVTDQGGMDDKSFNASAWKGMQAAQADANTNVDAKNVPSTAEADYEPNLTAFVNQKCDFILAVGGLMGDATTKVAKANPNQQFAIVDANPNVSNVYPMQFDTAQAAFLAGYLAAGYSKTSKVATYGGLKIPPVTIFMDGFDDGVQYYNQKHSAKVQVLGWNKATQNGLFAQRLHQAGQGEEPVRHAGGPGCGRHHAGRRRHRPRHHRRTRPRASSPPSGSTSTAARAPRTAPAC